MGIRGHSSIRLVRERVGVIPSAAKTAPGDSFGARLKKITPQSLATHDNDWLTETQLRRIFEAARRGIAATNLNRTAAARRLDFYVEYPGMKAPGVLRLCSGWKDGKLCRVDLVNEHVDVPRNPVGTEMTTYVGLRIELEGDRISQKSLFGNLSMPVRELVNPWITPEDADDFRKFIRIVHDTPGVMKLDLAVRG